MVSASRDDARDLLRGAGEGRAAAAAVRSLHHRRLVDRTQEDYGRLGGFDPELRSLRGRRSRMLLRRV